MGRGRLTAGTGEVRLAKSEIECHRVTGAGIGATDLAAVSVRGGRYHLAGWPHPLYASLLPETALAETERHATTPIARARITLIRATATLLDAYTPEGLIALGLRSGELVRRDTRLCIELSRFAHAAGSQGLLVPSAAATGEANLVIWREEVPSTIHIIGWEVASYPPPEEPTGTSD
jgi:RES domain-containing protein